MPRVDAVFLGVLSPATALLASCFCRLRRLKTLMAFTLVGQEDTLGLTDLPALARAAFGIQLRLTSGIITNSDALYEAASARYSRSKVRLIYNGTRVDVFKPCLPAERASLRCEQGANDGTVVFSFMGSLTERKGFDVLLSAFDRVLEANPKCHLWVIGPRNRHENHNLADTQVECLLRQCKNMGHVHLFGRIDDPQRVAAILSSSDVFVFPTRREGFPNALIEAMSCGIPVIAARLPGITDIAAVHGTSGYLLDRCDSRTLSEAMLRLAEDQALRVQLGKNARERVLTHFTFDQYMDQWRAALQELHLKGFRQAGRPPADGKQCNCTIQSRFEDKPGVHSV